MGWLGWSETESLATDVNSISLAMEGRTDMLRAIFGGPDEPPAPRRMTADKWKAIVRKNNSRYRKPRQVAERGK